MSLAKRILPCLDVDAGRVVKGTRFVDLVDAGDPVELAARYDAEGADELVFLDITATLEGREATLDVIGRTADQVFIPLTVGGGVRQEDDVRTLLRAGADKVAINTAATANPGLITEMAHKLGSQCVVLSIEAKRMAPGKWEVYTDNGREHTGRDVVEWVREGAQLGAGEVLLTSVDQEGTRKGFDVALVRAVTQAVDIPVIASGGMGGFEHLEEIVRKGEADAVAMADILHYKRAGLGDIRAQAIAAGLPVRSLP